MNYDIVKLSEAWLNGVAAIEQRCFSVPWTRDMLASELSNPTARFFLAVNENGCAVGYAGMYSVAGECYIANVAVLPEFRRQGIANKLLETLETAAVQENSEFVSLEVRQSNSGAIALYASRGYAKAGQRKNYYSSPCEDAVLMTKYFILNEKGSKT